MLTQQQLQKLEPLTTHAKYGKLLSDAIEVWKRENFKPEIKSFGVYRKSSGFMTIYGPQDSEDRHCLCLIGACLIDKTACGFYETIKYHYNISYREIENIIVGFDYGNSNQHHHIYEHDYEAYIFARNINSAIFSE